MLKKKKIKTYLGLETRRVSSPFSCCFYRDAIAAATAAAAAATTAVAAGVDKGGGDGRVDGSGCVVSW